MSENRYALKGIVVHTPAFDKIEYHENAYVICENGVSVGIFDQLPEEYKDIKDSQGCICNRYRDRAG